MAAVQVFPMGRRFLNVASIICCIACVALIGMWLRSYDHSDRTFGRFDASHGFQMDSRFGRAVLYLGNHDLGSFFTTDVIYSAVRARRTEVRPYSSTFYTAVESDPPWTLYDIGFDSFTNNTGEYFILPYWFLVLATGSLAMVSRLHRPSRFTLRDIFVATTFLAVVLGMITWLDRTWIGR